MITEFKDYREFLAGELVGRIKKNPNYSLRAFARDLEFSPSRLNDILKKKKGISFEAAVQLSEKLNLDQRETSYFCDLVQYQHSRSPKVKAIAAKRLEQLHTGTESQLLQEAAVEVISTWYHVAILELMSVKEFKYDIGWIANRLEIAPVQASMAIDRMLKLGLLKQQNDRLFKTSKTITTSVDIPSSAIRQVTSDLLEKAQKALHLQDTANRDFSSITFAIKRERLDEAKQLTQDFRRKMVDLLESDMGDAVYTLSVQLFRLDRDT